MEDIYDDLTNYEDVHALEELRTENKELKEMLENRTAAVQKLQKDYDTLEAEFKKLEHNYSSLLITARSEIERKTQRINQLNTEKDLMVLDALKSGKRIRRNFSGGQMKYEPGRGNSKNKEDNVKKKNVDIKKERCEVPVLPPKTAVPVLPPKTAVPVLPPRAAVPEPGTCDRNKSDNPGSKVELSSKISVNENIAQHKTDLNEPPKTTASSIKDRRKSMSAVSQPVDTFSSGDERDRKYQAKDTKPNQIQSYNERRNTDKMPNDRYTNKTSETSSVDDRVRTYHDSTSRDYYKGKSSRYPETHLYRSGDKCDVSLGYRKPYSPERAQKRHHREHHDDYYRYERERYKGRHLESPPPESYNRYQRRKSDHHPEYDRYSHDHEKYKYHHDDKYSSSKYRSKDYDEPHAKRLRTESYGNPDAYSKEDKRHYHQREPVDVRPGPSFSPHEYDMLRFSCQSPDFVHTDASIAHPVPEILTTSAAPLEDPRIKSKRYVISNENGKETLSTAVGVNIDIRPVNKAVWNIKPVDIPVALVRRPSQCSDQLVKDIYMDIGNPERNVAKESGEVRKTDEEFHEIRSKPKEIQNNTQDYELNKQVTKDISKQAPDVLNIPITNIAQYRIPKKGLNKTNTLSKMDVPIIDIEENVPQSKNVYRKTAEDTPKELLTHKQQYNEEPANIEDSFPNNKNYAQIEHNTKKTRSQETEDSLRKELSTLTQQYYEREQRVNVKVSLPNIKKYDKTDGNRKSRSRERENSFRNVLSTNKQCNEREERVKVKDSLSDNKKYSKTEDREKSRSKERENSFRKKRFTQNEHEEQANIEDSAAKNKRYSKKLEVNKKSRSRDRSENQNQATLTKIAIVADDLELSDDNSDHMDTNKRVVPAELQKNCVTTINMNKVETDDSGNNSDDKTLTSSHNTEIESTVDTAKIKDATEEDKFQETDGAKKQKSKKKKSKAKEIYKDLVESTADDIHIPEDKPRSKNEKESTPQVTKEKFSDLFGDSGSLMTPEDLGIPSYLPISEDTQDAVDMKINQIIDATPLIDKYEIPRVIQTQNRLEVNKIQETKVHEDIPKAVLQKSNTYVDDKEVVTEVKKKSSKKSEENFVEPSQLPSPIVFENVNPGTDLNDSNVVKTVIISTGKQPEIAHENKGEVTKPAAAGEVNSIQNTNDINPFPATKEYKIDLLKALATSTPHKEFCAVNPLLSEAAQSDVICDQNKAVATIINTEKAVNQNEINTLDTDDAPDVRIFVKRRRKVVKRPPMT